MSTSPAFWFDRALRQRLGGASLILVLFVATAFLCRIALLLKSAEVAALDASLLAVLGWGLLYDVGAGALFTLPFVVLFAALPARFFHGRVARVGARVLLFAALYAMVFGAVAEWVFWDEFGVRFNFIAVDYLVYTKEVVGNIRESYPMPAIFAAIAVVALAGYLLVSRTGWIERWLSAEPASWRRRWLAGGSWIGAVIVFVSVLDSDQLPPFANNYNRELAKDGLWALFAAFRNNELDYDQFYPRLSEDDAFKRLRVELSFDRSQRLPGEPRDTLRFVAHDGPELHANVIQITVESLSADFLSGFNRASRLTPNLDALAAKSLVFDQLYATGTRTDRGMEALTLSLPPTPGRSLIKRPHNEDLFTLGSVFRSRGYDTAFIYGGFGYFDNMNYFFGHNGYRVIDRTAVKSDDVTFANVWGACDEDLYRWTMREADADFAAGKPFHFFVMTTSNHRPFTYPDGRIDLPPKLSGRAGAVKYTDYAIGEFLRAAESKPWFRNTVFVIVADHCASVAGKTALPVENYHIPMLVYAPGGQVAPGRIADLMSQVDYAPTLLGLLNWSYASRFYGWDVRRATGDRRVLIGNYQKLGLYEAGFLSVLGPKQQLLLYEHDPATAALKRIPSVPDLAEETIAYYQTASYLYRHRLYRALSPAEQARSARLVRTPSTEASLAEPH